MSMFLADDSATAIRMPLHPTVAHAGTSGAVPARTKVGLERMAPALPCRVLAGQRSRVSVQLVRKRRRGVRVACSDVRFGGAGLGLPARAVALVLARRLDRPRSRWTPDAAGACFARLRRLRACGVLGDEGSDPRVRGVVDLKL